MNQCENHHRLLLSASIAEPSRTYIHDNWYVPEKWNNSSTTLAFAQGDSSLIFKSENKLSSLGRTYGSSRATKYIRSFNAAKFNVSGVYDTYEANNKETHGASISSRSTQRAASRVCCSARVQNTPSHIYLANK